MKPLDKGLAFILVALLASQAGTFRGCEFPIDVVPGPKAESVHAVIVHETGDREPWLGSLVVLLRQADAGKHKIDILDDDQLPSSLQASLGESLATTPMPALHLLDKSDGKLIYSRTLTEADTVDSIMASVKEAVQ